MARGRKTIPLHGLLVQGLSDHRTIKPQAKADDLQAPTVFEDDLEPGVFHEMKPQAVQAPQAKPEPPEYVRTAPINRNVSKHQAMLQAIVDRQHSLDLVMKLMQPQLPKPKHNEVHTESKLVLSVPTQGKPWRRV